MTDSHNHSHDHSDKAVSRLWITLFLNLGISVTQLIGGVISNSMALISDAVHNLSDTGSIGVSLIARTFANRKADKQMTFGYRRADIIGAFINLIILVAVSLFLIKEGVERSLHPEEIDEAQSGNLEDIKTDIKTCLSERFGIIHSSIEFELKPCGNSSHHS